MINVMLDPLPSEWNGYKVNTDFRVGLQVYLLEYDPDLSKTEKSYLIECLLFENENGELRDTPEGDALQECITWFLNGWYHDREEKAKKTRRLVDYDIDQWRIYADFLQCYHIDLSTVDMHWWMFNGLLWNMPYKMSSFMQVIEIRQKTIDAKMSKAEKEAIKSAKHIYDLEQQETRAYTEKETTKIDAYDQMMAEMRKQKDEEEKILKEFRR
nr:MAG TPA: hypothetical protein [Caudoviricetes sp.]